MEPDFEVEGCALVASGMQEVESDTTIDAAAEKKSYPKTPIRHAAREIIGLNTGTIGQIRSP